MRRRVDAAGRRVEKRYRGYTDAMRSVEVFLPALTPLIRPGRVGFAAELGCGVRAPGRLAPPERTICSNEAQLYHFQEVMSIGSERPVANPEGDGSVVDKFERSPAFDQFHREIAHPDPLPGAGLTGRARQKAGRSAFGTNLGLGRRCRTGPIEAETNPPAPHLPPVGGSSHHFLPHIASLGKRDRLGQVELGRNPVEVEIDARSGEAGREPPCLDGFGVGEGWQSPFRLRKEHKGERLGMDDPGGRIRGRELGDPLLPMRTGTPRKPVIGGCPGGNPADAG